MNSGFDCINEKETSPVFSVIVPVYNTPGSFFEKCIRSILGQTFRSIEVILIDDGSDEKTAEMCDEYTSRDSRVMVVHQANQGVSSARNQGIEKASGRWIMFVDPDDWIDENACKWLYEKLRNCNCDILMFNGVREYAGRQSAMVYGFQTDSVFRMDRTEDKEQLYRRAMGVPDASKGWSCIITYIWDKVYARDFLMASGVRFPLGLPKSEDKVFVLSCFEKMGSLLYCEKVFYHYRINDASICNRYSDNADTYRVVLVDKLNVIAKRMDDELRMLTHNPNYCGVFHEFTRFVFGLISDVLLLKYYHKDNPNGRIARHREALEFIHRKPFWDSIQQVQYKELSREAKLKKYLLRQGLVGTFCLMKKSLDYLKGKRAETNSIDIA